MNPPLGGMALASDKRPELLSRSNYLALAALSTSLAGLFYYKWGGAGRTIGAVRSAGLWNRPIDGLISAPILDSTTFYFSRIWIALVYGLLVGAGSQMLIPALLARVAAGRRTAFGKQVMGAAMGAPLMLCSCCVTPVFSSMCAADGADSALALLLSSPGLNPAAIALTFLLFPLELASLRLAAALTLVLVVPVLIRGVVRPALLQRALIEPPAPQASLSTEPFLVAYGRSLAKLAWRTVPAIVVGAFLSAWLFPRLPALGASHNWMALAVVAAVAALLTLPTFFELPLALLGLAAGFPAAAIAILIAGPMVNLSSMLSTARELGVKAAIVLAGSVWCVALAAGLGVMLRQ